MALSDKADSCGPLITAKLGFFLVPISASIYQVVADQLATAIFLYELTNIIVFPAPPDGYGVFSDFPCATY